MDFAAPVNHRVKPMECEIGYKYLDLAREMKKLWNKKETVIPIVIGAFGIDTKGLVQTGFQSQVESYQRLKKWYLMPPCLTLSSIR